jgi:Zn-finger nucleic acid-binding protein
VVVDACAKCGGFWLDRNEYEGLLVEGDQPTSLQLQRRVPHMDARVRLGMNYPKPQRDFVRGFVAGWLVRGLLARLG